MDVYFYAHEPKIRFVGIAFFSFIAVVVVLQLIGLGISKPVVMKVGIYSFPLFSFVLCLLAGVLLLVNTVTGDVCYWLDDSKQLGPWLGVINRLGNFNYSATEVAKIYGVRQECAAGKSIFDVIGNSGFVPSDMVNITKMSRDTISGLDFNSMLNGFDLSDSIDLGGDFNEQLKSFNGTSIGSFSFNSFLNESTKDPFGSTLDNFITSLRYFSGNLTETMFTHSPNTAPARASNVVDYRLKFNLVIDGLSSSQTRARNNITAANLQINQNIVNIAKMSNSTQNSINKLLPAYTVIIQTVKNFTTGIKASLINNVIPSAKLQMYQFIDDAVLTISGNLSCKLISLDLYAAQNSICVYIIGGLDAIWLSAYVVGFFSFLAVIVWLQVANKLATKGGRHGSHLPGQGKKGKFSKDGKITPQYSDLEEADVKKTAEYDD